MMSQPHISVYCVWQESVIEIEYLERLAAPEPEDSLLHDDWVAAVQAAGD